MEGLLSQCCPMGVCSRSECGLLPSLRRCVYFCSISYHKSIGARGGEHEGRLLDEEVLDAPEELRQPVFGVGGAQEDQGQERLALCSSYISQDSHMPWSWRGGARVSSGPIARQMEELEEERKKSRVGRGSLGEPFKSRKTVTPTQLLRFSTCRVAGCLQPRRPRMTETCVIMSCLLFFNSIVGRRSLRQLVDQVWRRRSTAGSRFSGSRELLWKAFSGGWYALSESGQS